MTPKRRTEGGSYGVPALLVLAENFHRISFGGYPLLQ